MPILVPRALQYDFGAGLVWNRLQRNMIGVGLVDVLCRPYDMAPFV